MLSITRKADYAIVAMVDLAEHHPAVVTNRDLSRRRRIPRPVLQKILTALTNQGLLVSVQGPQGGYRLSRLPEEITLAAVIAAIEGPFRLAGCTATDGEAKKKCSLQPVCPMMGSMSAVHRLLEQCLTGVSIADMASGAVPETVTFTTVKHPRLRKMGKAGDNESSGETQESRSRTVAGLAKIHARAEGKPVNT